MTREEQDMADLQAMRMEELESDEELEPGDDEMLDACKLFIRAAGGYTRAVLLLLRCAQEEAFGNWSSGYGEEFASFAERTLFKAHTALAVKQGEMWR
jgi:hypothetical protein